MSPIFVSRDLLQSFAKDAYGQQTKVAQDDVAQKNQDLANLQAQDPGPTGTMPPPTSPPVPADQADRAVATASAPAPALSTLPPLEHFLALAGLTPSNLATNATAPGTASAPAPSDTSPVLQPLDHYLRLAGLSSSDVPANTSDSSAAPPQTTSANPPVDTSSATGLQPLDHYLKLAGLGDLASSVGQAKDQAVQTVTGGLPPLDHYLNLAGIGSPSTSTPKADAGSLAPPPSMPSVKIDASSPEAFVRSITPAAEYVASQTGIPAAAMVAMAANETGYGRFAAGNNLFGIKGQGSAGSTNAQTWEDYGNGPVQIRDNFRAYSNPTESFQDFADLVMNSPRYAAARGQQTVQGFVQALKDGGYMTDPNYVSKITKIADFYAPVIRDAVAPPGAPSTSPAPVQGRTSQFALGLSDADAYAACGPAAAIAFAQRYGRNPTAQEALDMARSVGWTQQQGMGGVATEQALLQKMGVATRLEGDVNWNHVAQDASSGNPVIVSSARVDDSRPGHYWFIDGTRQNPDGSTVYHVGTSGTDLRAGSEWMTPDQMAARMGPIAGALYADNPSSPAPSVANADPGPSPWDALVKSGAQLVQQGQALVEATKPPDVASLKNQVEQEANQRWNDLQSAIANGTQTMLQRGQDLLKATMPTDLTAAADHAEHLANQFSQNDDHIAALESQPTASPGDLAQLAALRAQQTALMSTASALNDQAQSGALSSPQTDQDKPIWQRVGDSIAQALQPLFAGLGSAGSTLRTGAQNSADVLGSGLPDITGTLQSQAQSGPLARVASGAPVSPTEQLSAAPAIAMGYSAAHAEAAHNLDPLANVPIVGPTIEAATDPAFWIGTNGKIADIVGRVGGSAAAQVAQGLISPDDPNAALKSAVVGIVGGLAAQHGAGVANEALNTTLEALDRALPPQPAYASTFGDRIFQGIDLSAYPAEVRQGLENFAAQGHDPAAARATVQQWIKENPPPEKAAGSTPSAGRTYTDADRVSDASNGAAPAQPATTTAAGRVLARLAAARSGELPGDGELLGPSGPQRGQLQLESDLPVGGPRPQANIGGSMGPSGPQTGQLQFESELPVGGPRPSGTEASGPTGPLPEQAPLPGVQAPTEIHPRIQELLGGQPEYAQIAQDGLNELQAVSATPDQVARYFAGVEQSAGLPSGVDFNAWFRALRNGAMAGGLQTLGHVALNIPMQVLWSVPREAIAATLRGKPEQIPAAVVGLFKGLSAGWEAASQQLAFGITAEDAAAGNLARAGIALRTDNRAAQLGANLLQGLVGTHGAAQTFIERTGFFQKATQLAWSQAKSEGLHGSEFTARVSDILKNLTDPQYAEIASQAQLYGDRIALRGPQGTFGRMFQQVAQAKGAAGPVGNLLIPFESIANHVLTQGVESTPGLGALGLGIDLIRQARSAGPYASTSTALGKAAVTPAAERAANQILGVGAFAMGLELAAQGVLVGAGPSNPQERATSLDRGDQFDGIKLGSVFVPGHMFGRLWYPLAAAANVVEAQKYAKQGADTSAQIQDGIQRTATFFENETFMRSFAQLSQALKDPSGKQIERFLANMSESFIPQNALLRDVGSAMDPYARVPSESGDFLQNIGNRIAAQLPVVRESTPPRIVATTGQSAPNRAGVIGSILNPPAPEDRVADEALRLELAGYPVGITAPKATYQGGQQSPEQLASLQGAAGQNVQRYALHVLDDPRYANLNDAQKADALKQAIAQANRVTNIALGPTLDRGPAQTALLLWSQVPHYEGVRGTPEQIAQQNFQIQQARAKAAEYARHWPGMWESRLIHDDPQAWRLSQREPIDSEILKRARSRIDQQTDGELTRAGQKAAAGELVGVGSTVLDVP